MAIRYVGDAVIRIQWTTRNEYEGTVSAHGNVWRFDGIQGPLGFGGTGYDSPAAYDRAALSAVSFASYYTTHNRGTDTPEWAPPADVADAIENAVSWAVNEAGNELVVSRRKPGSLDRASVGVKVG